MQAILFADRHGHELSPLCDDQCPALLSIANKPVLQYSLEDLATAGIRDIWVVISDNTGRLQADFADGALWGLNIRYLLSRGEESPAQLLARTGALLTSPFVMARGDVLRTASCASFIALAASVPGPYIQASSDGRPIGLGLVRDVQDGLPALAWPLHRQLDDCVNHLDVPGAMFASLDSLADVHRTALMLTAYSTPHQDPPGMEQEPGLRVGCLSQVAACNRTTGPVVIGRNSWIHQSARLTGPCLVGDDCYIDRGVRLHDSIVMPGSYIGENLEVSNAIVHGDTLIRVDSGSILKLGEPKLLSSTATDIGHQAQQWLDRIAAGLLLLLSLPLWPLALLLSLLSSPRAPLCQRMLLRNRQCYSKGNHGDREVAASYFATRIPLLRHLPLLWLVIRGDLRLFGARMRTVPGDTGESMTHHDHPRLTAAGLLGPCELFLSGKAPEEEIHLTELVFVADNSPSSLFSRLLLATRLLFSRRAWQPRVPSLPGY